MSAICRRLFPATAGAMVLLGIAACGQEQQPPLQPPAPLQSALPTPALPNATAAAVTQAPQLVPTVNRLPPTLALVPTVVRSPIFLPTPIGGTPDVQATSRAVIATITALAAPPTYPPTTRPRPIGAGGRTRVTAVPTPTLDPSGISLLSVSNRVYRGGAGALSIRTQPQAACVLQLARPNGDGGQAISPVPGSASRRAGDDGVAAWIWQVDGAESPGALTLLVDCGLAGKVQVGIEVAK